MRRLAIVASVALIAYLLAVPIPGTAQSPAPSVAPKYLLVPGKSMGLVKLGMSLDEVKAVLGQPSYIHQGSPSIWYYFGKGRAATMNGVGVYIRGGKVSTARTFEAAYRTAEGLGVGSTLVELIAAYGPPQKQQTDSYKFNNTVKINELYVEWSSRGVSAHIDESTNRVAFFDIDTPK